MTAEPFKAFISYSRAASQPLAMDLQNGLERFAKPWYRLRALRIFRDDSSMAANTALWSTIETGLRQAEWFILLATPAAATSVYVTAEIDWWLRNKGPQRLLIVQAEGELHWDRQYGCFHPESTAVPPILRQAYPEEPRWIDLRWYADNPPLGRADPRFGERIADLSSALRGVERDTLVGDNVRQHRRALRLARAAVSVLAVLLVLSIVAGILAVGQRNEAREQARISQARQLAATARSFASTDIGKARLLAVQAYRLAPELQTEGALLATLTASPQLVREFDAGSTVRATAGTADGRTVVAANNKGVIATWDVPSGRRTAVGNLDGQPGDLAASADCSVIVGRTGNRIKVWIDGVESRLPAGLPAGPSAVAVSPSGNTIVVAYGADQTDAYALDRDGSDLRRSSTTLAFGSGAFQFAMSDDETVAAQLFPASEGHVEHRSLRTGRLVAEGSGGAGSDKLHGSLSGDGDYVAVPEFSNTGSMPIYRTDRRAGGQGATPDLIGYAAGINDPQTALSPNASVSAYAENDVIYVAPTQKPGPEPFAVTPLRGIARTGVNSLRFLSNRFLLSGSDNRLMVWDVEQNTPLTSMVATKVPFVPTYAISRELVPNRPGSYAVVVVPASGFTIIDAVSGAVLTSAATSDFLAWRNDTQLYYAESADRTVRLYDVSTRRAVSSWRMDWPLLPTSKTLDLWSARYVPDHDQLLVSGSRKIATLNATTGAVINQRSDLSYPTFSADGRWVFGIPDVLTHYGAVDRVSGGDLRQVATGPLELDPGAVQQNRSQLSGYDQNVLITQEQRAIERAFWTTDGSARIGSAPAGSEFTNFRVSISGDGSRSAQHQSDSTIKISDLRSGTALGQIPIARDDPKISFAYAGDGQHLLITIPADVDRRYPDGMIMSVDQRPGSWVTAACRTAGRQLTGAEWRDLTGTAPPADLSCR